MRLAREGAQPAATQRLCGCVPGVDGDGEMGQDFLLAPPPLASPRVCWEGDPIFRRGCACARGSATGEGRASAHVAERGQDPLPLRRDRQRGEGRAVGGDVRLRLRRVRELSRPSASAARAAGTSPDCARVALLGMARPLRIQAKPCGRKRCARARSNTRRATIAAQGHRGGRRACSCTRRRRRCADWESCQKSQQMALTQDSWQLDPP